VVIHGDETPRKCPRCQDETLRVEVVSETAIERCNRCEGLWIDRESVERLVHKNRSEGAVRAASSGGRISTATNLLKATADGYLRCPVCNQLMWRQNFGKISGVLIDVCRAHGTWFDRDELHRVIEFIRSGGLERSARKTRDLLDAEVKVLQQRVTNLTSRGHALFSSGDERIQSGNLAVGIADWLLNVFLK
jgi:Zn-finger nucleic acid-binding protein